MTHRLVFHDDPSAFLTTAAEHLAADPVLTTVVSSVTAREVALDADPAHPRWWVSVHESASDRVVGAAMRTARFVPHPLYVLPMPEDAARQIARALVERGEETTAVNGSLPAVQALADELARLGGGRARVHEHTRLHVLDTLLEPRPTVGRPRVAGPADTDLAHAWFTAFHRDAAEQAGRPPGAGQEPVFDRAEVRSRIDPGRVWLWEDDEGRPVSMVGFNAPSFGVARVGPVYTPGPERGRGYASALTAHVTRLLRDDGARVCLFTDQANPVSNHVYAALGYVPVVDMAHLVVEPTP